MTVLICLPLTAGRGGAGRVYDLKSGDSRGMMITPKGLDRRAAAGLGGANANIGGLFRIVITQQLILIMIKCNFQDFADKPAPSQAVLDSSI